MLNYKFKMNGWPCVDKSVDFNNENNILYFIVNEESYIVDINNKSLKKSTKEAVITIDCINNKIVIEPHGMNQSFDMYPSSISWSNIDNNIVIEYINNEGQITKNEIIISF